MYAADAASGVGFRQVCTVRMRVGELRTTAITKAAYGPVAGKVSFTVLGESTAVRPVVRTRQDVMDRG